MVKSAFFTNTALFISEVIDNIFCKYFADSTLKPSRSDLNHVCNNIGKNWKKLGNELGLGRGQIEAIEIDYRVEGTYEMAYQTILKWKRQNGDQVAIRDLALALDSIGMSELARELPVK